MQPSPVNLPDGWGRTSTPLQSNSGFESGTAGVAAGHGSISISGGSGSVSTVSHTASAVVGAIAGANWGSRNVSTSSAALSSTSSEASGWGKPSTSLASASASSSWITPPSWSTTTTAVPTPLQSANTAASAGWGTVEPSSASTGLVCEMRPQQQRPAVSVSALSPTAESFTPSVRYSAGSEMCSGGGTGGVRELHRSRSSSMNTVTMSAGYPAQQQQQAQAGPSRQPTGPPPPGLQQQQQQQRQMIVSTTTQPQHAWARETSTSGSPPVVHAWAATPSTAWGTAVENRETKSFAAVSVGGQNSSHVSPPSWAREKEPAPAEPPTFPSSMMSSRLFSKSFGDVMSKANAAAWTACVSGVGVGEVRRASARRGYDNAEDFSKAIGVYIYGMPKSVRVPEILGVFSQFGDIVNVGIVKREQRPYAFVDYEEPGAAAKAIEAIRGKLLFNMAEPLELRPHMNRKGAEEDSPAVPHSNTLSSSSGQYGKDKDEVHRKESTAAASTKKANSSSATTPSGLSESHFDEASHKRTLYIANIPQHVEKSDLEKLFRPFGETRRVHIVQRPKERRAFAFITFRTDEAAAKALKGVKEGRHLGMSESLKIDFSKAEQHHQLKDHASLTTATANGGVTSGNASPCKTVGGSKDARGGGGSEKQWKKGADLPKLEKLALPATSTAAAAMLSAPTPPVTPSRKPSGGRTTLYVREIAEDVTEESVRAKFTAVGPVRSLFFMNKIVSGSGRCAVVEFEKGEDAAKAVKEKVECAMFPRQRRLMIFGLPVTVQEAEFKMFLASFGEVRRVEILGLSQANRAEEKYLEQKHEQQLNEQDHSSDQHVENQQQLAQLHVLSNLAEANTATAEAEFARGDVAIVVFCKLLSSGYGGNPVRVGYSPSNTTSVKPEDGSAAESPTHGVVSPLSSSSSSTSSSSASSFAAADSDYEAQSDSRRTSMALSTSSVHMVEHASMLDAVESGCEATALPVNMKENDLAQQLGGLHSDGGVDDSNNDENEDGIDVEVIDVSISELDEAIACAAETPGPDTATTTVSTAATSASATHYTTTSDEATASVADSDGLLSSSVLSSDVAGIGCAGGLEEKTKMSLSSFATSDSDSEEISTPTATTTTST